MPDTMHRLRTETRDLHDSAERQDFQQRMVRGALTREEYAAWLGQMLLIHRALETPLAARLAADARFAAVTPEQLQVPRLLADLEALGVAAAGIRPLPATEELTTRVAVEAQADPLRLLGYHYVLEGSNNGNRFISRALLPALGLERDRGGLYLDPYGADQPAVWRRFKDEMGRVAFSAAEVDTLVDAAREMFAAIGAVSEGLAANHHAAAV